MASNKIKGINIKIGADTQGLDTALQGIATKSKSAKTELIEINKSLKSTPDSIELWQQKQEVLTKAIADSNEKVKLLEDSQEQLKAQLADEKISGEQYRAFQRELTNARSEAARLQGQLNNTNNKIEELGNNSKDAGKKMEDSFEESKKELKEVEKSIGKAPNSLVLWKQKQELLTKSVEESRKKVDSLGESQKDIEKKLQDGDIDEGAYRRFRRELEEAKAESKNLENQLGDTNKKIYDLENGTENGRKAVSKLGDSMQDADKDADNLGDSLEDAGKDAEDSSEGYTIMKGVLVNLVTQGINFAFDKLKIFTQQIIETGKTFESSMSNVQAISGASGESLESLSEKAKQMGATTKYTASQSADAFSYMALAGWEATDMLAGIDGVLSLAAGSNMDLAQASDIVTDYLTAFGLTAQDSGHFVDMMSYAMSRSNTTTELLGEAYKNCAATAASMGYSAEETTAVLMTMANAGVKGGEAGTALNAIMTRLATNTKGCATQLEEYDIHIYDTKGNMNSLSSILQGVSEMWSTLTDEEQANIAKVIAGTNHYSALQTIMNGLSDSAKESGMSFTDYAAALEECDGTAQNMADTMIDNLAGDMTILDSSIDGVKLALAEKLNPLLRDLVQYITDKMPEIQEKIEKPFDMAMAIAEWTKKNIPQIKNTISDLLPIITGVSSGFTALVTAKAASKAITGLTTTIKALNVAMAANPATAVAAAIAGLAFAIGAYYVQAETEVSKLQEISNKVDEQYSKEHKQIDETRASIQEVNRTFDESAEAIKLESDRTEYLWKQLDKLADENGKVKDANKVRAEYVLGELNKALGTEYELTGNQIEGYKELQAEIDKTIAKKKAEAYLDALYADASTMAKNRANAKASYVTASKQRDKAKENMNAAKKKFDMVAGSSGYTAYEIIENYGKAGQRFVITDEQYNAAMAYFNAEMEYEDATSRQSKAEANYNEVMAYYDTLNRAETAFSEGNYNEVEKIVYNPADHNQTLLENATDFDAEIRNAYNEKQKDLSYELQLALNAEIVNQDEIDDLLKKMGESATLGFQSGATQADVYIKEMKETIQKALDDGYDISALAEWAKDSGTDIAYILGDEWEKTIEKQLAEGYDITQLLLWAENSGKDISIFFTDEFKRQFEQNVGLGIDSTGLLKWAMENGKKLGDLVGENFEKTFTQYLYRIDEETGEAVNQLIPNSIRSESDAKLYESGNYKLGFSKNATGGYISSGNKGIVAEAGPELLEVVNGGVKITPLSRNANNTAVSGDKAGQKIFYNTYYFNNTRIANNMDICRIAQDLATQQRRIEAGRGLK